MRRRAEKSLRGLVVGTKHHEAAQGLVKRRWTERERRKEGKIMTKVKKKNESAVARISEATCLSFARFRSAIRQGRIDALFAHRIFRRHYTRLKDICVREGCSLARARTINAVLEADVNSVLVSAGQSGILKAYQSVDDLLRDLQS